jgi:hypothetical protein
MDIGSIFLILALLIFVGLFVARPLFERKAIPVAAGQDLEEHELSALLAERDRLLNALQELDFDHTLGKIPDEDYPGQRAALLQRGADVLRQIDAHSLQAAGGDFEARLEAAISARRADAAHARRRQDEREGEEEPVPAMGAEVAALSADDELEAQLAARRRARQDKSAGFCPQCGRPVQKSDRFCPKCGTALT